MWKSSEYCSFSVSWSCDHDLNYLTEYTVLKGACEWDSVTDDDVSQRAAIACSRLNDENHPFTVTCTCKPLQSLQILGFIVISEARTVESYGEDDGYLKSCRGCLENYQRGREEDAEGASCVKSSHLYKCDLRLDEPISCVTLKFLGLGDRSSFSIQKFHIVLVNSDIQGGGARGQGSGMGSIDLTKVRGYLGSLGTAVPKGGQDLLNAVEQYQQSQASQLSQMFGSTTTHGTTDYSSLTGLLSLAAKHGMPPMSSTAPRSCDNTPSSQCREPQSNDPPKPESTNQTTESVSRHLMKGNKNVLPSSGVLEMLMKSSFPQTGSSQIVPGKGDDSMLKMLQGICSRVSDLRVADTDTSEKETMDNDLPEKADQENEKHGNNTEAMIPLLPAKMVDLLQATLEQTVSQLVQASEDRLKQYIDNSLAAMETRLCHKLEGLVQILQKNGNMQTGPSENSESGEES